MSADPRGVYVFVNKNPVTEYFYILDGRTAAFTTHEKADAFRKAKKLKGYRLSCVDLCQADVCIPAVLDSE
jgi:hypothetical protein